MGYECKILLDSVAPCGARLTSFQITFPRFILAEVNTHRELSKCSASSRAIPIAKRITSVESDPFVPAEFGKNQKGMQASEVLDSRSAALARSAWLRAADKACEQARELADLGVHKQLANRLLEPFLWHTSIVSGTGWTNFFGQRRHKDAQPEFKVIADMMGQAYEASTPTPLLAGRWHMPYVEEAELEEWASAYELEAGDAMRISVARCARVSSLTQDGRRDPAEDLALFGRMLNARPMHASPFEHVAQALSTPEPSGNFTGWRQYRKLFAGEYIGPRRPDNVAQ
jgi:hypothetical protein